MSFLLLSSRSMFITIMILIMIMVVMMVVIVMIMVVVKYFYRFTGFSGFSIHCFVLFTQLRTGLLGS